MLLTQHGITLNLKKYHRDFSLRYNVSGGTCCLWAQVSLSHYNFWNATMADDFAELQPCQAQTEEEKIETLLDLLAGGFENDADLDLVRDWALNHLLEFPQLPDRTIEIMQAILADWDDSDLVLNRKAAAIDVLAHMGQQAGNE